MSPDGWTYTPGMLVAFEILLRNGFVWKVDPALWQAMAEKREMAYKESMLSPTLLRVSRTVRRKLQSLRKSLRLLIGACNACAHQRITPPLRCLVGRAGLAA